MTEFLRKLDAKVEELCWGDEKIAVALSGGIDSAAILFLLLRHAKKERIVAVTAVFGEYDDDFGHAARIANYFDVKHSPCEITADRFLFELHSMQKFFRQPRYNVWPIFLFQGAHMMKATTLVNGEGSDEIFGYPDRGYLSGWSGQIEWVQPAWTAAAKATSIKLSQPFLELNDDLSWSIKEECFYQPGKQRLKEMFEHLPTWIITRPTKAPSHAFYRMLAQEWKIPPQKLYDFRNFELVKRKLQLMACESWIEAWRE